MLLSSLIASNDSLVRHGPDVTITGITADSRQVKSGFLFVAIPGTKQDGRVFIEEAFLKGAAAVLAPLDTKIGETRAWVGTSDIRASVSTLASLFYHRQPEVTVAITGTSGKTSSAQFTRQIWQGLGYKSASVGTLGYVTQTEAQYGSLTTPDAITLHKLLDESVSQSITHLAMEASSHGLVLKRLDHVKLKGGAFTNLSRDHLDFHETMEQYAAAKLRLFTHLLPEGSVAVINADSDHYELFLKAAKTRGLKIISFGKQAKELRLLESMPMAEGQKLRLEIFGKAYEPVLPLVGSFQANNILAALGLVLGTGSNVDQSMAALSSITGVPGRMQMAGVKKGGGAVFVDYAHKPDALLNVLTAMRPHVAAHPGAQLGVVFGCGGNRDTGKRPMMGSLAQKLADWVIVTDDNPRFEDPSLIRKAILAGCSPSSSLQETGDRALAIAEGVKKLGAHDILVIAGKGHEPGQIIGDKTLPFDDLEVARKVLQS